MGYNKKALQEDALKVNKSVKLYYNSLRIYEIGVGIISGLKSSKKVRRISLCGFDDNQNYR